MKKINVKAILAVLVLLPLLLFISCNADSGGGGGGGGGGEGQGGSMARFTICGDFMYTVNQTTLRTINLQNPQHPYHMEGWDRALGFDIETIFPYDNNLFIGSRDAMHIYSIEDDGYPNERSKTTHFSSCDPVVAYGDYAYVTLNNANLNCSRGVNQMQVYDISDLENPFRVYARTMNSPKGLGVDGKAGRLFVCENRVVTMFDISETPEKPVRLGDTSTVKEVRGITTYDVIPIDGLLIVIGSDGLYQFDYTGVTMTFQSKIDLRLK